MANRIPRLTKRAVDALKVNGADTVYWDGDLTGFRVRRSGRKYYVVQTRVAGKLHWFTVGPHGPLSPDQARGRAREIRGLAPGRASIPGTRKPGTRPNPPWPILAASSWRSTSRPIASRARRQSTAAR